MNTKNNKYKHFTLIMSFLWDRGPVIVAKYATYKNRSRFISFNYIIPSIQGTILHPEKWFPAKKVK